VSDQDFFSEGEQTEVDEKATKAPAKGVKSTAAKSSANRPASRPAAKGGSGTAPKSAASKAPQPEPSFFDQTITMAMASLLAIIGLLLGVIIGYFIFSGGAGQVPSTPATGSLQTPGTTATGTAAPPLSQDQLNKGQLPAGHPQLPGSSTPTTPTK
jgi:hypothetical protein